MNASEVDAATKSKPFQITTLDGVTISAQEWGNPTGPELLFIHAPREKP
jgi:hypothetical protein